MSVGSGHSDDPTGELRARALRELSELIASSEDVFVLADHAGSVIHANDASALAERIAAVTRQQMPLAVLAAAGSRWRGEVSIEDADPAAAGSTATFDVQVVCGEDTLAIHARDISASVRLQQQLAHLASHDALTDLPNRSHLLRRLADAVDRSRSLRSSVAILYVDIDDLKRVNDAVGHDTGDALIAAIGKRLVAATRPDDVVARIGGDEFVVLSTGIDDEETASAFAERLRRSASGLVAVRGTDLEASVSVGVVMYRGVDVRHSVEETAESLLRDADKAMYHAKALGKGRCEVYTDAMRAAERERSQLAGDLANIVGHDQLFAEYQPIASPHTGHVGSAEALVRWRHPSLGVLPPASFLPLAEESRAGAAIGDWMIRRALSDLRQWIDDGRVDGRFTVHVNVSRTQVARDGFADAVSGALDDFGLRPSQLVLEFSEAMILDDDGRISRVLQSLRRQGVRLSLDDFGAGTSSLTNLRQFPVDFVKLDGSLVRGLGEGDRGEFVVRSVVQLAHGFEASVVAEAVTSALQVDRLTALGCDFVQGFHIGEPLPAAQFAARTGTVFRA